MTKLSANSHGDDAIGEQAVSSLFLEKKLLDKLALILYTNVAKTLQRYRAVPHTSKEESHGVGN